MNSIMIPINTKIFSYMEFVSCISHGSSVLMYTEIERIFNFAMDL